MNMETYQLDIDSCARLRGALSKLPPPLRVGDTTRTWQPRSQFVTLGGGGVWTSDGYSILREPVGVHGHAPLSGSNVPGLLELLGADAGAGALEVQRWQDGEGRKVRLTLVSDSGARVVEDDELHGSQDVAAFVQGVQTRTWGRAGAGALRRALQAAADAVCHEDGAATMALEAGVLVLRPELEGAQMTITGPALEGGGDELPVRFDARRLWAWAKRLPGRGACELRTGTAKSAALFDVDAGTHRVLMAGLKHAR